MPYSRVPIDLPRIYYCVYRYGKQTKGLKFTLLASTDEEASLRLKAIKETAEIQGRSHYCYDCFKLN